MNYQTELGLWLLASLSLSVGGSWLAWRLRHSQSRSIDWLRRRLVETSAGQVLVQLVRFLYYVGLPYVAVLRRALSLVRAGLLGSETSGAAVLGWSITQWAQALGWIASLGALIAVLLALGWRNALRAQGGELTAHGVWPPSPWWVTLREGLFSEIHWAFYRVGPLLILGDVYWAVLVGAAFPLLEWALDPDWWVHVHGGARREQVLLQCLWLGASTLTFFLTHNTWLAIALHLGLALGLDAWLAWLLGGLEAASEIIHE